MNQAEGTSVDPKDYLRPAERWVILVSTVPTSILYSTMTPVLQKMESALATGPNDAMLVRVALTVVGFAMMFGAPLAGWIIDRIGVRLLMICAVIVWVSLGCFNFFVHDLHLLVATRFIQGLASSAAIVSGATLVGKIPNEIARGRMMGYAIMTAGIISVVVLILAGLIGDIDWRYTFLLYLLYLPMLGCALMLKGGKLAARVVVEKSVDGLWRIFPYALAVIAFIAGFATYSGPTYMPFRYHEIGIDKSSMIGYALTAQSITISISAGLYGFSRRWLSAAGSFQASFIVTALGILLSVAFHDYWLTTAGQLIYGFGLGGMIPNIFGIASAASPEYRGRITGVLKGLFSASTLIMAIVLEPVMRVGGSSGVLLVVAGLCFAIAIAVAVGWNRYSKSSGLAQAGEA